MEGFMKTMVNDIAGAIDNISQQTINKMADDSGQVKKEKQKASSKPKWDFDDIIDRETFMKFDFPRRADYCIYRSSPTVAVDTIYLEMLRHLNMRGCGRYINYFLENANKIKETGTIKWVDAVTEGTQDQIRKGMEYAFRWMSIYSIIFTEMICNKKNAKQIIRENVAIGTDIVTDFVNLIQKEQEIGYFLPISKCAISAMGYDIPSKKSSADQEMNLNNIFTPLIDQALAKCKTDEERAIVEAKMENQGEQKMKEIDNMKNLLDIMKRHLSNKLTPQDIADLKANVKDWEKDIEKLSEMLNDLPDLDLEQVVSGK